MNNLNYFKTISGYCNVFDDKIIFTKYKDSQIPVKHSHPLTRSIVAGIVQFSMIALLLLSFYFRLDVNVFFLIVFGMASLLGLVNLIYDLRYSRQVEILKESIIEISLVRKFPLFRNSRVHVRFKEGGIEKETKILVPYSFKEGDALLLPKKAFQSKGYSLFNK